MGRKRAQVISWLPPGSLPLSHGLAEGISLCVRPQLQGSSSSPTGPAHQILGASPSPPPRPGDGNVVTASASPSTSPRYKRKGDAETSKALAVTPTTTKIISLTHSTSDTVVPLPPPPPPTHRVSGGRKSAWRLWQEIDCS